jgi:hypothetical protein
MRATNVVLMRGLHRRVSSGVHQTRVIDCAIDADSRGVLRHFESEARDRPEKVIFVREPPIQTGGVNESETQERIRARKKIPVSAQRAMRYTVPERSLSQAVFHLAG